MSALQRFEVQACAIEGNDDDDEGGVGEASALATVIGNNPKIGSGNESVAPAADLDLLPLPPDDDAAAPADTAAVILKRQQPTLANAAVTAMAGAGVGTVDGFPKVTPMRIPGWTCNKTTPPVPYAHVLPDRNTLNKKVAAEEKKRKEVPEHLKRTAGQLNPVQSQALEDADVADQAKVKTPVLRLR